MQHVSNVPYKTYIELLTSQHDLYDSTNEGQRLSHRVNLKRTEQGLVCQCRWDNLRDIWVTWRPFDLAVILSGIVTVRWSYYRQNEHSYLYQWLNKTSVLPCLFKNVWIVYIYGNKWLDVVSKMITLVSLLLILIRRRFIIIWFLRLWKVLRESV